MEEMINFLERPSPSSGYKKSHEFLEMWSGGGLYSMNAFYLPKYHLLPGKLK